jgi:hypothetical protein
MIEPNKEFLEILVQAGQTNPSVGLEGQHKLAKAFETPLRKAILVGDVVSNIYERITLNSNTTVEYPIDLLNPGEEIDYVAYTNPGHGRIPERAVEGDYVQIPTYGISNSIDFLARYARDAHWNVAARALQVLEAGFVKKINDDGWHVLLAAGVDRNILVYDADAAAGQFTKRLVSILKSVMLTFTFLQKLWKIFETGVLISLTKLHEEKSTCPATTVQSHESSELIFTLWTNLVNLKNTKLTT